MSSAYAVRCGPGTYIGNGAGYPKPTEFALVPRVNAIRFYLRHDAEAMLTRAQRDPRVCSYLLYRAILSSTPKIVKLTQR